MFEVAKIIDGNVSPSDPWTGKRRTEEECRKRGIEDARGKMHDLEEAGEIVSWHGLVTVTDEEVVKSAIADEFESDITRDLLVDKLSRVVEE